MLYHSSLFLVGHCVADMRLITLLFLWHDWSCVWNWGPCILRNSKLGDLTLTILLHPALTTWLICVIWLRFHIIVQKVECSWIMILILQFSVNRCRSPHHRLDITNTLFLDSGFVARGRWVAAFGVLHLVFDSSIWLEFSGLSGGCLPVLLGKVLEFG